MENKEVNKYLTEKMGLCWHDHGFGVIDIWSVNWNKCGILIDPNSKNNDLFSPEGFFILWNWAIKQDWWMDFEKQQVSIAGIKNKNSYLECMISIHAMLGDIINDKTFPIKIYNYLKESE